MKTLLLLNGTEGWQTGIEDGFLNLKKTGSISELKWFYFEEIHKKEGIIVSLKKILDLSQNFLPDLIIIFHIGKFPIDEQFIISLKNIRSNPLIVYDEGDMYGGWAKPITNSMRLLIKHANIISLRGLGSWYHKVHKLNQNIIYTPHHADIARFDREPYILNEREYQIILIGNRISSRILSCIRRLNGASGREKFVKKIGQDFQDKFKLFGNGWAGYIGNQGPVDFQKQIDIYRNSWITIAYEHYPNIPYYFSNRLPIALLAGSLYVCHYHKGYENIFKNCDFIFFFKTNHEAIDIIKFLLSLNKFQLIERSKRAREFALLNFTPEVVWGNFFQNVNNYKLFKNFD